MITIATTLFNTFAQVNKVTHLFTISINDREREHNIKGQDDYVYVLPYNFGGTEGCFRQHIRKTHFQLASSPVLRS